MSKKKTKKLKEEKENQKTITDLNPSDKNIKRLGDLIDEENENDQKK